MPEKRSDLFTLTMILKDEAATITRTLESIKPFIDRWVILDTGSTDGTQDVVRRAMEGVPGELHEEPFVDFATTRNRALDLCGEATEFVMWLDADDIVENGRALRQALERERALSGPDRECYYVRVDAGVRFDSPRVLRAKHGWRFKGVVHEVLVHPDRPPPSHRLPDVLIRHLPDKASAERSRKRWERDVGLLSRALEENPTETRAAFYLALTLLWLERYEEAEKAFERRIAMGGWAEEIYHSKLSLARIAQARKLPWPEVQARYLDTYLAAPHRAEPLHAIAAHYDSLGQHALTFLFARRGYDLPLPVKDALFIDEEVYTWRLADLLATSAYWIGEFSIGEIAARRAVDARPADPRLKRNLQFYLDRKQKQKQKPKR